MPKYRESVSLRVQQRGCLAPRRVMQREDRDQLRIDNGFAGETIREDTGEIGGLCFHGNQGQAFV